MYLRSVVEETVDVSKKKIRVLALRFVMGGYYHYPIKGPRSHAFHPGNDCPAPLRFQQVKAQSQKEVITTQRWRRE